MPVPQTPQDTAQSTTPKKDSKLRFNSFYNSTFAITWDLGMVMILVAVAGLFDAHFLGLNLSYMHCFVLAASGSIAIYSGMTTKHRSFVINLILGVFFMLNAILGFLIGDRGHLKIGYGSNEDLIVKFAPGFLELSTFDHIFHLALAVFMLIEAYSWKRKSLDFPANLKRHRGKS
jgi:hypothetical protein